MNVMPQSKHREQKSAGRAARSHVARLEGFGGGKDERASDHRAAAVVDEINRAEIHRVVQRHQRRPSTARKAGKGEQPPFSRWMGPRDSTRPQTALTTAAHSARRRVAEVCALGQQEKHPRQAACREFFSQHRIDLSWDKADKAPGHRPAREERKRERAKNRDRAAPMAPGATVAIRQACGAHGSDRHPRVNVCKEFYS
jgi:hypothetical protein